MAQAEGAVIDQQEGTEAEASGRTRALRSLYRPSAKSALTHHRHRLVVVWPAAIVRPPGERGRDGSTISFPLPVYTADANGGLCIGRSFTDAPGAWGSSDTNKLHQVYTGALLATTICIYNWG